LKKQGDLSKLHHEKPNMDTPHLSDNKWLHFLDPYPNSAKAGAMKQYLRNQFDFIGITSPERKLLLAGMIRENGLPPLIDLEPIVRQMWNLPYREYHYCALELLEKRKKALGPHHVELLEFLLVNHSWWDTVDMIASHLMGALFRAHPELILPYTMPWLESGNIWLKRTCLLFQLKYKKNTDLELLRIYIVALSQEPDFFLRKAIGWILREYAKTDPDWVVDFVSTHELSALSRKEAMKGIEQGKFKKEKEV
jgi:3-methyladenine DNA glycosylase AlkD